MKVTWIVNVIVSLMIATAIALPNTRMARSVPGEFCYSTSRELSSKIRDYNDQQIFEKTGKPLFSVFTESEENLTMLRSTFPDLKFESSAQLSAGCNYGTIGDFSDENVSGQIVCLVHGFRSENAYKEEATFFSPDRGQFTVHGLPTPEDVRRSEQNRLWRFAALIFVVTFLVVLLSMRFFYNLAVSLLVSDKLSSDK